MYTIRKTDIFETWLDSLGDIRGRAQVLARIERLKEGHLGVAKSVGGGVSELVFNTGPGYRVYFKRGWAGGDSVARGG